MRSEFKVLGDYIRDELGYPGEIDPDADLLEKQILDSFSVVQVAVFIQEHFGVALEADDLVRENLSSLNSMVSLIDKRRSGAES